jgi:hypothetical protein
MPADFAYTSTPDFFEAPTSGSPERRRAQLRVARRLLDRSMAEPILDASRVVACICQGVPAAMPEHMGMNRKGESGTDADALETAGLNCLRCSRRKNSNPLSPEVLERRRGQLRVARRVLDRGGTYGQLV